MMKKTLLLLASLCLEAQAIKIELRYDYDAAGFFNNPAARVALRAVADYYEQILTDPLPAIVPGSGNSWTVGFFHPATLQEIQVANLHVPADTVIVYAIGAAFSGNIQGSGGTGFIKTSLGSNQWYDLIFNRGQGVTTGAAANDFGPWGGSIAFNPNSNWNFDFTGTIADPTKKDFVSVALHEMGHVLGIGTCESWDNKIVWNNATNSGHFIGVNSVRANGGVVVPLATDKYHWKNEFVPNKTNGSFGKPHGVVQSALMDPEITFPSGRINAPVLTDVDLAALADVGWNVQLKPEAKMHAQLAKTVSWPSSTMYTYTVQQSTDLVNWTNVLDINGNSDVNNYTDATGVDKAFFKIKQRPFGTPMSSLLLIVPDAKFLKTTTTPSKALLITSTEPRAACACGAEHE